jgi:hypothetical protein
MGKHAGGQQKAITAFFAASGTKRRAAQGDNGSPNEAPPAKRPHNELPAATPPQSKLAASGGGAVRGVPVSLLSSPPQQAPPAEGLGPSSAEGAAATAAAAPVPGRDARRHARAQAKLVGAPGSTSLAEPGARGSGGGGRGAAGGCGGKPKYTPLEEQVGRAW